MSIEPAIAAVVGWVLLGQSAGAMSLTAVALVVVASAGITLGQGARAPLPSPRPPEAPVTEGPHRVTHG